MSSHALELGCDFSMRNKRKEGPLESSLYLYEDGAMSADQQSMDCRHGSVRMEGMCTRQTWLGVALLQ
jgi:hypothetical protein